MCLWSACNTVFEHLACFVVLSVGDGSFRRKCLRRRQALSEGCESSKPASERSSQTSGESTDGRQSPKPTGNEQQNRACVLDGGWVEAVCLVAGSDAAFQLGF